MHNFHHSGEIKQNRRFGGRECKLYLSRNDLHFRKIPLKIGENRLAQSVSSTALNLNAFFSSLVKTVSYTSFNHLSLYRTKGGKGYQRGTAASHNPTTTVSCSLFSIVCKKSSMPMLGIAESLDTIVS